MLTDLFKDFRYHFCSLCRQQFDAGESILYTVDLNKFFDNRTFKIIEIGVQNKPFWKYNLDVTLEKIDYSLAAPYFLKFHLCNDCKQYVQSEHNTQKEFFQQSKTYIADPCDIYELLKYIMYIIVVQNYQFLVQNVNDLNTFTDDELKVFLDIKGIDVHSFYIKKFIYDHQSSNFSYKIV